MLSFILLFAQYRTGVILQSYFFIKKLEKNKDIYNELVELNSQLLELKKENSYLLKYKEIYNKIGRNRIKSFLEVKYINNNQNGKYIIAYSNNDVKKNDLVVDKYGILIGRIVDKKDDIVKVQMITDYNSNIPVNINETDGLIYGSYSSKCNILFQNLSNITPNEGDVVMTRGFENLLTSGVIVGKVKSINNNTVCIENKNIDNIDKLVVIY